MAKKQARVTISGAYYCDEPAKAYTPQPIEIELNGERVILVFSNLKAAEDLLSLTERALRGSETARHKAAGRKAAETRKANAANKPAAKAKLRVVH